MLGNDGSRFPFASSLRTALSPCRTLVVPASRRPSSGRPGSTAAEAASFLPPPAGAADDAAPGATGASSSAAQIRLSATREAPANARRFVADALTGWQLPAGMRDDVVLAVSELVSDAATYPLAVDVDVTLLRRGDRGERVELVVRDASPEPPLRVDPVSGAGELARAVLDTCSDHWSWSAQPRAGRVVRASFRA